MHVKGPSWAFYRVCVSSLRTIMPWRARYSGNVRTRTIETRGTGAQASCIIGTFLAYHTSFARSWSTCVSIEDYNTSFHSRFAVGSDLAFVR